VRCLAQAHATSSARAKGAEGAEATLAASCRAYVGFARDHPSVSRVMFRPELCDAARFAQLRAAGERAHGELMHLVRFVRAGSTDPALVAMNWAQVHGLAGLLLDGPLGLQLGSRRERPRFAREATARYARLVAPAGNASP
jgi:hypothetical protein